MAEAAAVEAAAVVVADGVEEMGDDRWDARVAARRKRGWTGRRTEHERVHAGNLGAMLIAASAERAYEKVDCACCVRWVLENEVDDGVVVKRVVDRVLRMKKICDD